MTVNCRSYLRGAGGMTTWLKPNYQSLRISWVAQDLYTALPIDLLIENISIMCSGCLTPESEVKQRHTTNPTLVSGTPALLQACITSRTDSLGRRCVCLNHLSSSRGLRIRLAWSCNCRALCGGRDRFAGINRCFAGQVLESI